MPKSFMSLAPGVNLKQLFVVNLLMLFRKLNHFIVVNIIFLNCENV